MSWDEALAAREKLEAEMLEVDTRIDKNLVGVRAIARRPEIMLPAGFSLGGLLGGLPPPRAYAVLRRISRGYPFMTTALRFFTVKP